jgi:superfamily II DNA or RNA helicase
MDELLLWAPKGLLGEFRKLNSPTKDRELVRTIKDWFNSGGVLIVGYERFRILFENKKTEKREARFGEDEHEKIKRYLLEGPNIIIADEAHKMKNASTGLAKSTKLFESKSRIALTGSPLANNVEEYHTMIDWIALNYLGPADEFRAKYAEPIQAGLWNDSSGTDRRHSLKMLRVLGHDLAPKVHRADMTVLRNDLPPKKEFVITVPLTDLQQKAYTIYVQSMVSGSAHTTKDGEFTQTTLWNWLAILSLLCNHPDCFNQKLHERQDAARKEQNAQKSISGTDQEENISTDLNTPIWKIGVSPELVNKVTELFQQETNNLKAPDLSYKVKILFQILDRSKAVGDKVLVFSQSIPTLNYVESLCTSQHRKYFRLDGSTPIPKRQEMIKKFNVGDTDIALISTAAGGLGLNITGANRVVIFDFKYNPIMEEQAVGRAYRIGQKKEVFVYRLIAGGTFEDSMHNKAVFKTQLASRVVDKKNPVAWARKGLKEMLFEPKVVEQKDLSGFVGMDRLVLDEILASQATCSTIRGIVQTDTFEQDSNDKLTAEEEMEVQQLIMDKDMRRSNPAAFNAIIEQRNSAERNRLMGMGMTAQVPRKRGSNSKGSNSKASMYAVPPLPIIPIAAPRQEPSNPTAAALLPPQPPVPATGPVVPLHPSNPTAIATPRPGATEPGDGQLKGLYHLPRTKKHPGNNTTAVQPSHAATSGSSITGTTASPTVDELAPSNPAENPIPSQVTKPSPVVAPLSSGNSTSSNGGLGNIDQVCIPADQSTGVESVPESSEAVNRSQGASIDIAK